ncbi:WD_REPEATS_REGION domain-containing protein [Psidium guajava]|nr:WD_REPEATS_REGION domain-containing protein [Psidium guajava]
MEEDPTFDPELIHSIFKSVWMRMALERERNEASDAMDNEAGPANVTSKKNRPTTANANALKLSCELLRLFIAEAVQRAAAIAEAEGMTKIEATHLERILPQLLLDF